MQDTEAAREVTSAYAASAMLAGSSLVSKTMVCTSLPLELCSIELLIDRKNIKIVRSIFLEETPELNELGTQLRAAGFFYTCMYHTGTRATTAHKDRPKSHSQQPRYLAASHRQCDDPSHHFA